jgi:hypothetical protein
MPFNPYIAITTLAALHPTWTRHTEYDYAILRVAGVAGLGVLSIDAMKSAVAGIKADFYAGRRFDPGKFARMEPAVCYPRWAEVIRASAERHPVREIYPLREPAGHVVGTPPCFNRARKGQWTSACKRAAWGNIEPYGLEPAEKPCPGCGRPMRYWCQGRRGEPGFGWSVDHVRAHAAGGCVCPFNLAALCQSCNSAKGKGRVK